MLVEGLVLVGLLGFFISVPIICISYNNPKEEKEKKEVISDPMYYRQNIQ